MSVGLASDGTSCPVSAWISCRSPPAGYIAGTVTTESCWRASSVGSARCSACRASGLSSSTATMPCSAPVELHERESACQYVARRGSHQHVVAADVGLALHAVDDDQAHSPAHGRSELEPGREHGAAEPGETRPRQRRGELFRRVPLRGIGRRELRPTLRRVRRPRARRTETRCGAGARSAAFRANARCPRCWHASMWRAVRRPARAAARAARAGHSRRRA